MYMYEILPLRPLSLRERVGVREINRTLRNRRQYNPLTLALSLWERGPNPNCGGHFYRVSLS
jgi:hypothetical protein